MADKKKKAEAVTPQSQYEKAGRLTVAIRSMLREKDKADMYEQIAAIYKKLGDYEDSPKLYEECINKAKEHMILAQQQESEQQTPTTVTNDSLETSKSNFSRIIKLAVFVCIIGLIVAAVIYLQSDSGKYFRASAFEKIGNHEKAYKMFKNLDNYSDSEIRYYKNLYLFAEDTLADKQYEKALKLYQKLGETVDSQTKLTDIELKLISDAKVGANVIWGKYHWLILEKEKDKVLLVKSLPINGFPYHSKSEDVTWETSSLREYLNLDFIDDAEFNEFMQTQMIQTSIQVPENIEYKTFGGNATDDYIFLLNSEQFNKYADILNNYKRDYWLINPGHSQDTAQFVSYGKVMEYGYDVTDTNIHIRPAMWISTEKAYN